MLPHSGTCGQTTEFFLLGPDPSQMTQVALAIPIRFAPRTAQEMCAMVLGIIQSQEAFNDECLGRSRLEARSDIARDQMDPFEDDASSLRHESIGNRSCGGTYRPGLP